MIKSVLIANRGEIACRIIKTAKKLGIKTFAIYSDIDQHALHTQLADEALYVGPAPSQLSYLNQETIIKLAKANLIDAIHPGYGFLAENADFAKRCKENSIIFIGPNANAISQMGDKAIAKKTMSKANVPLVPGYEEADQSEKTLFNAAKKIGFPLLIKASAGGGGKGMRLVNQADEFSDALSEAKSEAKASFGNDTVLLEKYLNPSRHVEVQIFADTHQQAVYLFDRDCSIQRRHQKIIEEAPAPNIPNQVRKAMGEAAVRAAKAIDYSGAGTVEFLLDSDFTFYFMEMNTRLQVEHPVTEFITDQDLVEWQFLVANGEKLPLNQKQLKAQGHAIEVRLCAENTDKNFIPATGKLEYLKFPPSSEAVRVDTGVVEGDTISPFYDPMIAKLIVKADTREAAISELEQALYQTYICGLHTNLSFLTRILKLTDFKKAALSTEFITHHTEQLTPPDNSPPEIILAAGAIAEQKNQHMQSVILQQTSNDPNSPWNVRDHWQPNNTQPESYTFWFKDNAYTTAPLPAKWLNEFEIELDNHERLGIFHRGHEIDIFYQGEHYLLNITQPLKNTGMQHTSSNPFAAPMPATIVKQCVKAGDTVNIGDKLLILEAMKMQHSITAQQTGSVKVFHFNPGDLLQEGDILLDFEAEP